MYFVIFGTDKPHLLPLREQVRPSHRLYLRQPGHRVTVRLAGPTHAPDGGAMNGTLLLVEAATLQDVEDFVRADPYSIAGLFQSVDIRPWTCGLGAFPGAIQDE
ncbi:YciI family protein [Duganella sp. FT92W]|uniref:YciI family protein n=1 Tax=Pseudoduganella rivuli TaxID=2666085 RepID=A0A7X2IIJ7_9BURK|nr:YciI family protein [Pseudoduganella rivuli]MRV70465.1 YciI family protein [Pseudoduganella rivuli]